MSESLKSYFKKTIYFNEDFLPEYEQFLINIKRDPTFKEEGESSKEKPKKKFSKALKFMIKKYNQNWEKINKIRNKGLSENE